MSAKFSCEISRTSYRRNAARRQSAPNGREMSMKTLLIALGLTAAAATLATPAHAVYLRDCLRGAPCPGFYAQSPRYSGPPRRYYGPSPYYAPSPQYYGPSPYYAPSPQYYGPSPYYAPRP